MIAFKFRASLRNRDLANGTQPSVIDQAAQSVIERKSRGAHTDEIMSFLPGSDTHLVKSDRHHLRFCCVAVKKAQTLSDLWPRVNREFSGVVCATGPFSYRVAKAESNGIAHKRTRLCALKEFPCMR
jgi:hypothetical protein